LATAVAVIVVEYGMSAAGEVGVTGDDGDSVTMPAGATVTVYLLKYCVHAVNDAFAPADVSVPRSVVDTCRFFIGVTEQPFATTCAVLSTCCGLVVVVFCCGTTPGLG
jgi:hypothetical protein